MDGQMGRPSYRDAWTHLKENVQSNIFFISLSFMKKVEKNGKKRVRVGGFQEKKVTVFMRDNPYLN